MRQPRTANTLRIIGGNWRSRKISFASASQIRPTPDRIRETLFNWLQNDIHGAKCLELYAGSGILSIEALSRGAKLVSIIDSDPLITAHINRELSRLDAAVASYKSYNETARSFLRRSKDEFDIVFVDPPFDGDELGSIIANLANSSILSADALIYVESPNVLVSDDLPSGWKLHRQKKAATVHYALIVVD